MKKIYNFEVTINLKLLQVKAIWYNVGSLIRELTLGVLIMLLGEVNITTSKIVPQKPLIEIVQELCEKSEPKPLYCELPEDLKLRNIDASGTIQTYTNTSSMIIASGVGTSTTTTY